MVDALPSSELKTALDWGDLILPASVLHELNLIVSWAEHQTNDAGLGPHFASGGYRALFHGAPGTGKTLAAALIGKRLGRPVHRVDLSMLVLKYIGETEKNLGRIFDEASEQGWVLFFDEADALFGTRTATPGSKDRHANQQAAYLLQRIEGFDGLAILAANLKSNIDNVFARRFQLLVGFPIPDAESRQQMWDRLLKHLPAVASDVDPIQLAADHELSLGSIANVVEGGVLEAHSRSSSELALQDILAALKREHARLGPF